jgi:CBS domain-containing protein
MTSEPVRIPDMSLLRIARVPPPTVQPGVSVLDAVATMARDRVGAVAVVEGGALRGIFTERDLMLRVVMQGRSPEATLVRDVMTTEVKTVTDGVDPEDAIHVMLDGHLRHLPILGGDGRVLGLLSIRALLEDRMQDLSREVNSLEQYMANDGPGG